MCVVSGRDCDGIQVCVCVCTVEPPLSGPGTSRLSGMTSSLIMGVSAAVTMDTGMYIFCACSDAHIFTAVYEPTYSLLFIN